MQAPRPKPVVSDAAKRIVTVAVFIVVSLALLLVCAGRLAWSWAWIFAGTSIAVPLFGLAVIPRDVIAERGKKKENVEPWDRLFTLLIQPAWFAQYIVAGLDDRFGWTPPLPIAAHLAALAVYLAGNAVVVWAMSANRFFSTAVRIQDERGHVVCTGGPYRFVRHPGYVGMILFYLATPIILGSWWGLIPSGMVAMLLVVRTVFEDATLKAKLEGYEDYSKRVRYRLVPGIW